jgi:hypothetical protein
VIKLSRKNADMNGAYPAMLRAAQRAREVARMYKTPLVLWQDGKVVEIPPDEIEDLPKELLKLARFKGKTKKRRGK